MPAGGESSIQILLAEDNPADVYLVKTALAEHKIDCRLHVIADGSEAEEYVGRLGKGEDAPRPDLILLDLNLPGAGGAEILRSFRQTPECAATPVIVVTSSDSPNDRESVASYGIAGYFQKPSNLDSFLELGGIVKNVVERDSLSSAGLTRELA